MIRKTLAMILTFALTALCVSAAFAASPDDPGLFALLAREDGADERLAELAEVAETVGVSVTNEDGITVEIDRAYYEGDRVFVSYRLSGEISHVEMYEGRPEGDIQWTAVYDNFIAAENWSGTNPELQKGFEWLDGTGKRWTYIRNAGVQDGLNLEDGTYADIFAGEEVLCEDGTVIGWKECRIPQEKCTDPLTFCLVLSGNQEILFQDGSTLRRFDERGEKTEIRFTLNRNASFQALEGVSSAEDYQAEAHMALGNIDFRGTVRLTSPEQAAGWTAWQEGEDETGADLILCWNLYQNGEPLSADLDGSTCVSGEDEVIYELQFPLLSNINNLTLVPEYSGGGEHPDEAIALEPVM